MVLLENRIRNNINTFKKVFQSRFSNFKCFYSFKANFLPEICKIINSEEVGAEIVGLPELKLALDAGFPADRMLIGGPYLPDKLLKKAIKIHPYEMILYNLNNLERINSLAYKNNIVQNICLRINSQKYGSRLGIALDKENLRFLKKSVKRLKHIKITTILSHYGTQMNNAELFIKNLETLADGLKILSKNGINIKKINLGGGFPEATIMPEKQLKYVAEKLKASIKDFHIQYEEIYFEPGRFFIGDAGIYLAKIIKIMKNRWVFLNLGNNICPRFAKCSLRFYNVSQINKAHKYKTSFAGVVPTDQDVLAKDYFFTEKLSIGDKILITNVGAYTLTFSNRFPYVLPNIFLIKGENYVKIFSPELNHDFSIF